MYDLNAQKAYWFYKTFPEAIQVLFAYAIIKLLLV